MIRICSFLLLGWLAGSLPFARGGDMKPVFVISSASCERFLADMDYLGASVQNRGFTAAMGKVLARATKVQDLAGLDRTRPCGAAISTDGLTVAPVAFFPVKDAKQLLTSLAPLIGDAQPAENGLWKIGQGILTGFVKQQDGWAYLAQSPETLAFLPDPTTVLGDLPGQYDVAVRLNPPHIPEALRTMAIDQIRLTMRESLARFDGENDTQYALRRQFAQRQFSFIEQLFAESGQVTLGWNLDSQRKNCSLELAIVPVAGSTLASRIAAFKRTNTTLSGLSNGQGLVALHAVFALDTEQRQQLNTDLETWNAAGLELIAQAQALTATQRSQLNEVAQTLREMLGPVVQQGKIDAALALDGQRPPLTMLAAVQLGSKDAAGKLAERLNRLKQSDTGRVKITLDAAVVRGAKVHAIEFTSAEQAAVLESLFGKDQKVYLTVTDRLILAALGNQALPALDRAVGAQETAVAPLQLTINLATLAQVASLAVPDDRVRTLMPLLSVNLKESDSKLVLSVESNDRGLRARIEGGEGLLRTAALGLTFAATNYLSQQP